MDTYVIPVTAPESIDFCYYLIIYAENSQKAFENACKSDKVQSCNCLVDGNFQDYQIFKGCLDVQKYLFHISERSDILNLLKAQEESIMPDLLYDTIYMKDYNQNIEDLVAMAMPEKWNFPDDTGNQILKNYLGKTLERLQEENKVVITDSFLVFNTGLFTCNYESIYLVAEKARKDSIKREWVFKEFCTEYDLDSTDISDLPQRANYFTDPSLLLFNWNYPVRVQYGHILEDNKSRLPKSIIDSKMKFQLLTGAIDTSIKKVIANYKLAVPQYYDGKIQLLIPLYFEDDNKPDLALTVTKKNGYYQGHTCITLDMAYNNARIIAKPESNWLTI